MGLKLTVNRYDKILMSNGVVIDIGPMTHRGVELEFHAPRDIEINTVFNDSSKQFKNMRKKNGK